jgi:hypothetical protein
MVEGIAHARADLVDRHALSGHVPGHQLRPVRILPEAHDRAAVAAERTGIERQ